MYRGGEDADIFERKKSSPSNLYGSGFYFTESRKLVGVYGEACLFDWAEIQRVLPSVERRRTERTACICCLMIADVFFLTT